jgi:hypothetical protein
VGRRLAGRQHCFVFGVVVVVVVDPQISIGGPQSILNWVPGALEAPLFVCVWTYNLRTTLRNCMQLCA